ncbi:universal stress protein, partial [Streptomyces sp. NPDC054840]
MLEQAKKHAGRRHRRGGQVLLSAASNAQLLVVGRRPCRTPVGTRIGSVARAVLPHVRCPVAVVPHAGRPRPASRTAPAGFCGRHAEAARHRVREGRRA